MKRNLLFDLPRDYAPDTELLQYLPCHPDLLEKHHLNAPRPSGPVLFFLYHKNRLVYIGHGKLYYRISQLLREGKVFDSFAFLPDPSLETIYIRTFKPLQNKYGKSNFSSYRKFYYVHRSGRQKAKQLSFNYPLVLF